LFSGLESSLLFKICGFVEFAFFQPIIFLFKNLPLVQKKVLKDFVLGIELWIVVVEFFAAFLNKNEGPLLNGLT
jgi:hypothetical protein